MRLHHLFGLLAMLVGFGGLPATLQAEEKSGISALVDAWLKSPHGNYHSPSFTYWNKQGEIPTACAACHSEPGFLDFLGTDGSTAGVVDHPGVINSPIGCASCHSAEAHALNAVRFPSGVTVDGLGTSATCTVCHQGRQSGAAVSKAVANLGEDEVSAELGFLNIHYGVAAATMHGSETGAGYQYPGKTYAGRFFHVPSANTCVACHDPHSTKVAVDDCLSCHRGVEKLTDIRMRHGDFDGDGDVKEGIQGEIMTLHARLGESIQAYGRDVAGTPIGYHKDRHPYFFRDTDGNGTISDEEAVADNRYQAWTPRLLKAAYNYQVVKKDPGGYVHHPTYQLQLLYDSLESLSEQIGMDMAGITRP